MKSEEIVKERLRLAQRELPNISKEIETAREDYRKDKRWYGNDADPGYLEQMRREYGLVKKEIAVLEWVLLDSQSSTPTVREKK